MRMAISHATAVPGRTGSGLAGRSVCFCPARLRLEDGTEFYAGKLVASSVDLEQTFGKMLPAGAVPKETQEDVEGYKYQDVSLFTVHMAMHKVPTYKAAAFDPAINQAWVLNIGYECLEDYNEDWAAIRKGEAPAEPKLNVAINTMMPPISMVARIMTVLTILGKIWETMMRRLLHPATLAKRTKSRSFKLSLSPRTIRP